MIPIQLSAATGTTPGPAGRAIRSRRAHRRLRASVAPGPGAARSTWQNRTQAPGRGPPAWRQPRGPPGSLSSHGDCQWPSQALSYSHK
eukprot:575195-Hanusia_phi.AAC.1